MVGLALDQKAGRQAWHLDSQMGPDVLKLQERRAREGEPLGS